MPEERRTTRQRRAVERELRATDDFVSAQTLHARLKDAGEAIGLATVYRALAGMADDGLADVVRSDEGEALYRVCARAGHHHHLVCRACGHAVEIDAPQDEAWIDQVASRNGFTAVSHTFELFGTCATCAR